MENKRKKSATRKAPTKGERPMTWSFLLPVRSVSINPAFIVYHNTLSLQHCARTGIDTTRFIECNTETGRYIISGGGQEACHDIKILADHTQKQKRIPGSQQNSRFWRRHKSRVRFKNITPERVRPTCDYSANQDGAFRVQAIFETVYMLAMVTLPAYCIWQNYNS